MQRTQQALEREVEELLVASYHQNQYCCVRLLEEGIVLLQTVLAPL